MMCASCHMNTVCKQCDRKRSRQTKKGKERETPIGPAAAHLSSNLSRQTVCWIVSGPESQGQGLMIDITPLPLVHPHLRTKLPQQLDQRQRLGEGGNKIKNNTQSDMNTGWQQLNGGNTTPFSTRFAAQSTQMESGLGERERTDGQTHKQRADSTPHSQSQSHYREVGSRDWRCNNTFSMPLVK